MRSQIFVAALAAGLAAGAAGLHPARGTAQTVSDEVVVTARYHGRELRSLSVPVSYRDLDLSAQAGRETLKRRVRDAAKEACRRLGEANVGGSHVDPSCEQAAIDGAAEQERVAFARAKPRGAQ